MLAIAPCASRAPLMVLVRQDGQTMDICGRPRVRRAGQWSLVPVLSVFIRRGSLMVPVSRVRAAASAAALRASLASFRPPQVRLLRPRDRVIQARVAHRAGSTQVLLALRSRISRSAAVRRPGPKKARHPCRGYAAASCQPQSAVEAGNLPRTSDMTRSPHQAHCVFRVQPTSDSVDIWFALCGFAPS